MERTRCTMTSFESLDAAMPKGFLLLDFLVR